MLHGVFVSASQAEERADLIRLTAALLLLAGALIGYYVLAGAAFWMRIALLLGGIAASLGLLYFTRQGRLVLSFFNDSQIEVKKVIWPGRRQTAQTTLFVLVLSLIAALILWFLDWILGFLIGWLLG